MEYEIERCNVCGEYATHALGISDGLLLCDNVVCYHASIELIKEALEKAQGDT